MLKEEDKTLGWTRRVSVTYGKRTEPTVADQRQRVCILCGSPLSAARRSHARYCSGACRAEAARLRAILNASGGVPYRSVAERMGALQQRTRKAFGV
jgi:hypothetical protein